LHVALQLREEVLLVAAAIGLEDDRLGGLLPIVADVEKAARVIKELFLTAIDMSVAAGN